MSMVLKKSVSTLQKRNYAPKKIKTLSGFGGCRLQHPPKPPTVFGARCVSRRPMKSETYFKTSRTIFAKIQLYSLYSPFVGENAIKLKAKGRRIPERREANTSKHGGHL